MKEQIQRITIDFKSSILLALKQMDLVKHKLLIVTENKQFKSLLSIGDIQRAIISNIPISNPISEILRQAVNVASVNDDIAYVRSIMKERRNEFMPIIDEKNNIVDIIFWEDLFTQDSRLTTRDAFDLPIVIMAGGKGSRLKPLTNVLPKPLIPIGDQTIIEDIMDRFVDCGSHEFYLSLNYKSEIIKNYFSQIINKSQYHIQYFQEEKPLGTAGSLNLLKDRIRSTFFVSNCDIIIDEDYTEILKYHRSQHNEITVVAAIKNIIIPYGTLETVNGGQLRSLSEKPEYTFKINTGMYILEPNLLNEIPQNKFYHITDLIEKLCSEHRRVGVFPINEGSWTDIGSWDEYMKCVKA